MACKTILLYYEICSILSATISVSGPKKKLLGIKFRLKFLNNLSNISTIDNYDTANIFEFMNASILVVSRHKKLCSNLKTFFFYSFIKNTQTYLFLNKTWDGPYAINWFCFYKVMDVHCNSSYVLDKEKIYKKILWIIVLLKNYISLFFL